jgi:hypothetical protein
MGKLNIDLEADSPEFGPVADLMALWVKQGYLTKIKESVSQVSHRQGGKNYSYEWGPRSRIVFPEEKIAQFMASVMQPRDETEKSRIDRQIAKLLERAEE